MASSDAEWVQIQKRTFTNWVNGQLKKRNLSIESLDKDFQDGYLLVQLLEIISAKDLGKHKKHPKLRAQQLENAQLAIKFIKDEGIKLVNISGEDFVDGKLTLILGTIWTLILRYQINKGGVSASFKNDLLKWIQSKIGHRYDVQNFTTSWKDGVAIAELVEALKPGQLDNSNLKSKPALENATLAENLAEQNMGIPQLCSPEDFIAGENADELSNMTYLSLYRDYDRRMNAAAEEDEKRRTADPSKCVAYGPGLTSGKTHQPAPFTIEARNCYGDRINQGGETFEITIKGPKNKVLSPKVGDNNDGTYSVEYVPEDAGTYWIGVNLRKRPIQGHPWQPVITRSEASASHSKISGPGIEPGNEAGKPTHFLIAAHDSTGTAVPSGGDPFVCEIKGPWGPVQSNLRDNQNGTYTVDYTPLQVGTHIVSVTLKNAHVDKSSYEVLVLRSDSEADAAHCTADGPGLAKEGVKAHIETEFYIHARNSKGSSITIDPSRHHFAVDIVGAAGTKEEVSFAPTSYSAHTDGALKVVYTPTVSGTYNIAVELHDPREAVYYDHIQGSVFVLTIKPTADANTTEARGPGIEDGVTDTDDTWFDVITKDANGNPLKEGNEDVGCKITGPDGSEVPSKVEDKGDGTYHVVYRPSGPGRHTIVPTIRGKPIRQAPIHVNAKAGTSSGHSFIEGHSFRIRAADIRGQPKTTGGDTFAVQIVNSSSGEQVKGVTVIDNKDGSYTCTYSYPKETAAGSQFELSATLNGEHIRGSPWKQHF